MAWGNPQTSHWKFSFACSRGRRSLCPSLALSWIALLPHVGGRYLHEEWMCLRAGRGSQIGPPQTETSKRVAWRLHLDLWACSAQGGACRSALCCCGEFLLRRTCWTCGMLLCPLSTKILKLFQFDLGISITWKERDPKPQPWKLNTSGLWTRFVLHFHSAVRLELELSLKSPSSVHADQPAPLPVVQGYEPVSSTAFSVYSNLDRIVLGLFFWEEISSFSAK